jgi:hypothetical protein
VVLGASSGGKTVSAFADYQAQYKPLLNIMNIYFLACLRSGE